MKTVILAFQTSTLPLYLLCATGAVAAENGSVSTGLPLDKYAPVLVTVMVLALLLSFVIHHRRAHRSGQRRDARHRFGEKLADIAYAPEMEQVGPLRPQDTPNAFTQSINSLTLICHKALLNSQGKTLALIGTRPDSGTTTVAIAIARRLAYSGQRTLLLDLNFQCPMVQLTTGAISKHGISNYLLSGLVEGVVVQDKHSSLDIIGTGNLPPQSVSDFLAGTQHQDSLASLFSLYDRIIMDCTPAIAGKPDVSRIIAGCDLRLLLVDSTADTVQSPNVEAQLRIHRRWRHGITLLVRNKVKSSPEMTASRTSGSLLPQGGLRPLHAEKWILHQPDELYTLKLTEMRYRPVLTRRQISNYAGHQVACFRLTVLGEVNYLLILGRFKERDEALQAALSLGLTQSSVHVVSFADIKKGIRLELQRNRKANLAKDCTQV